MHYSKLITVGISILFLSACSTEEPSILCADDMLNIGSIPPSQIEVALNDEKFDLEGGVSLATDESVDSYRLRIGCLIPNDVLEVPVNVTSRSGQLLIEGETTSGVYPDINITGVFSLDKPSAPHLNLDIKYEVNSKVAGCQYIFDLQDNPFNIINYKAGTTDVDGVSVDNAEAIRMSAKAINRELADRGKKIRLVFEPSGILTVDTLDVGNSEWMSVDRLRYWITSNGRESITIGLDERQKAVFGNLWFGEPLDYDAHVYFSSLPLNISIKRNGDYAFFTIKHIIQTHLLWGYIDYKKSLNQWTKEEYQSLRVLNELIYQDRREHGQNSSIWSIQASVNNAE